jgi:hypothetical protein
MRGRVKRHAVHRTLCPVWACGDRDAEMILSDGDGDAVNVIRSGWFNLGLARESIFWKLSRLLRRTHRRRIRFNSTLTQRGTAADWRAFTLRLHCCALSLYFALHVS